MDDHARIDERAPVHGTAAPPRAAAGVIGGPRLGLVVAAAIVAFSLAVYPRLPESLPTLVGAERVQAVQAVAAEEAPPTGVDALFALEEGRGPGIPRWPGAFVGAALAFAIWGALALLARFDPGRGETGDLWVNVWRIGNLLVLLTALVHGFTLGAALGWPADAARLLLAAAGVVFLALAEYLPEARFGAWVAIRTPWTLASERVWIATHRLAGRSFLVGAWVTLIGLAAPEAARPALGLAGVGIGGFVPVVYSLLAARRAAASGP